MIKVIITGTHGFNSYRLLTTTCDHMLQNHGRNVQIVCDTEKGVGRLAEIYAEERGYEIRKFDVDRSKYGNVAEFVRNKEMVSYSDAIIAFWDGASKATYHIIQVAKGKGIKIKICGDK